MLSTLLDPATADWPSVWPSLEKAMRHSPDGFDAGTFRERLASGFYHVIEAKGEFTGHLVYRLLELDGEMTCSVVCLSGRIDGAMVQTIRALMRTLEDNCRSIGVRQLFIGGRDWGRVLPDYELTGARPNERRKRL